MNKNIADQVDFSKFGVPSWRIEQKFSPGVLIGNWAEDRYKFPDVKLNHNSTYQIDFQNFGNTHPDVTLRRQSKMVEEGIPADMLFRHHGKAYDNMLISLYDENYNGRWREKNLPPLRKWDHQTMKWLPERIDHPLVGYPTNWGLKERKEAMAKRRQKELNAPEFESTYMGSYQDKPAEALRFPRSGIPRPFSTTLLPSNNINCNLYLRGKPNLRMPEVMPEEMTRVSV
ncbi:hypothetical protein BsWGS_26049 [Bradybaena similaris]